MKNPIIHWLDSVRPTWRFDSELLRVALVLRTALRLPTPDAVGSPSVEELCEALGEAQPEQREFWLRVDATEREQFLAAMTAMFETSFEGDDDAGKL